MSNPFKYPLSPFFYFTVLTGISFWLILLLATVIYWQGFSGTYLLDDDLNLERLSTISQPPEYFLTDKEVLRQVGRFITEGGSSQMGRPISLLSFALQAHQWREGIEHFKYINLMLHLLNACLIFWFILYLCRFLKLSENHRLLFSFLTSVIWLLHPLQVSTVSYVIQRMVELMVFFTVGGLLAYLHGRARLIENKLISGYFWVSLGIVGGCVLGVLSKENGILLVLYILVLEITVLSHLPKPPYWKQWQFLFLYAPLLLLLAYFAITFPKILETYKMREFTLGERLLTEARILIEYFFKIFIPRLYTLSLYHDDYIVSRNLWTPITTLPAVLIILGVGIAAIKWRRRYPIFAFGVLWFLAGHSLESTFLPLMLYFEHRNYLPMLVPIFAIIYGAKYLLSHLKADVLRRLAMGLYGLWALFLPIATWSEAKMWGNAVYQAVLWAEEKPLSRYAQSYAASIFFALDKPEESLKYYRHMVEVFPKDAGPYVLWISAACRYPQITPTDLSAIEQRFQIAEGDTAANNGLFAFIDEYLAGRCSPFSVETVQTFLRTLAENEHVHPLYKPAFYNLYAKFLFHQGQVGEAIAWLDKGLALKDNIDLKMQRLTWLIQANRLTEARAYIQQLLAKLDQIALLWYAEDLKRVDKNLAEFQKTQTPYPPQNE